MPQIHDTSYAWFRLAVTLVIAIFANTGMWAVITIMPALEAEFATSRATTSLPFTMNMIGFALGNLVIGRIIDKIGVTLSVMAAAIVSAAAFLHPGHVHKNSIKQHQCQYNKECWGFTQPGCPETMVIHLGCPTILWGFSILKRIVQIPLRLLLFP